MPNDLLSSASTGLSAAGSMMALGGGAAAMATPVGWIMGGLALGSSFFENQSMREEGRELSNLIGGQMGDIRGNLKSLGGLYGQKKDIAQDTFGEQMGVLGSQTGNALYDISQSADTAMSKANMATSGTVTSRTALHKQRTMKKYGQQKQSLENQLGQQLMGIEEWYGGAEGDLQSQLTQLEYQKKQADKQANKKWLGIF